jgi:glycosyltransferase involved in cell wall biosynthesis
MMCSASAVYLPVSQGVYEYASMPGKLFEYLGSGRPILASALAPSEVASTLSQVGGARRIDPGDIESLAAVLEQLCAGENNAIFSARIPSELARYTRASLTAQLSDVLNTVATRASTPHPAP